MASTTVPIQGDRELVHKLAVLAAAKKTTIGNLVREAVDLRWSEDLERMGAVLLAESVPQTEHSSRKANAS